jgi:hypothetical protein
MFSLFLKGTLVAPDNFELKLGRIRDPKGRPNLRTTKRVLKHAGSAAGMMRQRGHILPSTRRCGMAPGVLARAGLIAPGSRRIIVRARYRASAVAILVLPAVTHTNSASLSQPTTARLGGCRPFQCRAPAHTHRRPGPR